MLQSIQRPFRFLFEDQCATKEHSAAARNVVVVQLHCVTRHYSVAARSVLAVQLHLRHFFLSPRAAFHFVFENQGLTKQHSAAAATVIAVPPCTTLPILFSSDSLSSVVQWRADLASCW